jgi:hypothetical protein
MDRSSGGFHSFHNNLLCAAFKEIGYPLVSAMSDTIVVTIQDLAKYIDNRSQTDLILLDFSKAFDKVPHKRLLCKINYYGIRHSTNQWIANFLEGRTQQVLVEGVKSTTGFYVCQDVP